MMMMSARNHQDHEPARNLGGHAEGDVDRDQQALVGQGIEQRPDLALHVEALGEEPVDCVTDAGDENNTKATAIWPEVMAQMMTGTSRIRPGNKIGRFTLRPETRASPPFP